MTCSDSITVERRGEIAVVAVAGEIDAATRPAVQDAIDGLIDGGRTALVIDMSKTTFMSSAGLRILASTRDRLGERAALAVVADGPAIMRPIQLTEFDKLVSVCSTMEQALTTVRKKSADRRSTARQVGVTHGAP